MLPRINATMQVHTNLRTRTAVGVGVGINDERRLNNIPLLRFQHVTKYPATSHDTMFAFFHTHALRGRPCK